MPRIKSNAVEIATEYILSKIENYELKSEDIISDIKFAEELGMSRTPVREAIMSLIENGILERNRSKIVVKSITLKDILEIIDIRDAIEQKALELIVEKGGLNKEQLSILSDIQDTMTENILTGNVEGNFHADHLFHLTLFEFADNSRLYDIHKNLLLQSKRLRWLAQLTPGRFAESQKEHLLILESLKRNDAGSAKQNMHLHLMNTKNNYISILDNPQWLNAISEIQNMKHQCK